MSESKRLSFEDMLEIVGDWSYYQLYMSFVMFFSCITLAYLLLSSVLFLYPPPHYCKIPDELLELGLEQTNFTELFIPTIEDGTKDSCNMYSPDNILEILLDIEPSTNSSWPLAKCSNGWHYELEDFFHTAVSEFNWVCDDAWIVPSSNGIFFIGAGVGTFLFGFVSDYFGRLIATYMMFWITFASGIALGFTNDVISFNIVRFIMGMSYQSIIQIPFVLCLEYVPTNKRAIISNLALAFGLTLGGVFQPFLLYYVRNWRTFTHILFGQLAITFLFPLVMVESGRWLISVGQLEKSFKMLKRVSKINRKKISAEDFNKYEEDFYRSNVVEKNPASSILSLFKTPRIRKHTILTVLNWVILSLLFDAHLRNLENLNFSIFFTFTVSAAVELPGDILTIFIIDTLGRKFSTTITLILSGILIFIPGYLPKSSDVAIAVLAMVSRFFLIIAVNCGEQILLEIFPTNLRSRGGSLCNIPAQFISFVSPFIGYSAKLYRPLPFIILTALSIIGGIFPIFLIETTDLELPDTVEEAEMVGSDQSIIHIPYIERRKLKALKTTSNSIAASTNTIDTTVL